MYRLEALAAGFGLCLLAITAPAGAANWDGPVKCSASVSEPYVTICHHPELLEEDRQVAAEYRKILGGIDKNLAPGLFGKNSIFVAQQMAWNYDHYILCRPDNANKAYKDGVYGCAKAMLDERLRHFRAMEDDPSVLMSAGAQYDHVDPWYLRIFIKSYEGRTVSVQGWPDIEGCRNPGKEMQVGGREFSIKLEFEAITPRQLAYICSKAPATWWRGTVKLDAQGEPYLLVTDLSGVSFPWDKGAAIKK